MEHCRGEPYRALPGGHAQGSARLESSSIVDEPGECITAVRESKEARIGRFLREKLISDHGLFSSYKSK